MQSTARWNAPSSHHILLTGILATGTAAISSKRLKLRVVTSQAPASPSSQAMDSPHRPQAMDSPQRRQESGKLAGSVVALGKFDALHIGHRSLAEQASRMGPPVVLSFTGMGEILGWDKRLPVVAPCDRARVMLLWSAQCSGLTPDECSLEFGKVRHLSPQQFVEKLAVELRVKGVVAGENYRFGYKAAGDSSELKKLCKEWGLDVFVVEAVMDKFDQAPSSVQGDARDRGQVSSTRVRKALADGNMKRVTNLLGRNHRLFMTLDNATRIHIESEEQDHEEQREKRVLYKVPLSDSCNQYPAQGSYRCKVAFQGLGQQQQTWNGNGGALERSWECDVEITEDEARIWDLETPESLERRQGFVSIEFR